MIKPACYTEPENFPQFARHQKAADIWNYGRKKFNRKMKERNNTERTALFSLL